MKKTLLIATVITLTQGLNAQITQASEPAIGATASMYLCDSNTNNMNAVTGATATWDYSSLAMYAGEMRTITQLNATTAPNATDFPSSVTAFAIEGLLTTYSSSTVTERTSQGFVYNEPALGSVIAKWSTDEAVMITYPFAYSNISTDNFSGNVDGVPGGPYPATGTVTTTFDGTGTMLFPSSVSVSGVSRIKTVTDADLTTMLGVVNVKLTQYDYYDFATTNLPIFTLTNVIIVGGPITTPMETQLVLSKYPGAIVGLSDKEEVKFSMYPNPATDELTITGEFNEATMTIVNAVGQVVTAKTIASGEKVSVSNLQAGLYIVKIEKDGITTVKNLSIK